MLALKRAPSLTSICQACLGFWIFKLIHYRVLPIVRQIKATGATTRRAIAAALNARGVRTARGCVRHDSTVRNLVVLAGNVRPHSPPTGARSWDRCGDGGGC